MDGVCDTFVLDCDGVIWCGEYAVPGSIEAIRALRAAGRRVLFVTNSSGKTREGLAARLRSFGVEADPEHVVTSASALALFMQQHHPDVRSVMLLGSGACAEELRAVGVSICDGSGGVGADGSGEPQCVGEAMTEAAFAALEVPPRDEVGAVLLGGDYAFTYAALCRASLCLQPQQQPPGAPPLPFLCTSLDAFDSLGDRKFPGPTAIMAYGIEQTTGRTPVVVGKPSTVLAAALVRAHGLEPARVVMVGDRLDSDIAFGKNGGFVTALVRTGVTDQAALQASDVKPDFVFDDLAAVVRALAPTVEGEVVEVVEK